jgi:hypothetical protein
MYGIREFQVGPVARGLGVLGPIDDGVLFREFRLNVGLVDVTGEQVTVSGLGISGDPFYSETLTPDMLTPRA